MKPLIIISVFISIAVLTPLMLDMNSVVRVDLILYNGRIYTLNAESELMQSVAVRDGYVVATGTDETIRGRYSAAEYLDLEGKTVLPGFIDAHAHLVGLGRSLLILDLTSAGSSAEIVGIVAEAVSASKPGEWIEGRGWDQNVWPQRRFPTAAQLDRISPDNPVYLRRVDGHAVWVNSVALRLAGITRQTRDPDGGRIIRAANGDPSGVLIDAAAELVVKHIPPPAPEDMRRAVRQAIDLCLSYGLTGVHDMGVDLETIELYQDLISLDEFPLRVYGAVDGEGDTWEYFLRNGPLIGAGNRRLTVRAIKLYADGALGSRGAALIEPYSDEREYSGLVLSGETDIYRIAEQALGGGFQVCTHAIGDRGTRIVLNAYDRALQNGEVRDHRFRIEHAQVVAPEDFPRFAQSGVIPSMQPIHCTSDMGWAVDRLGPARSEGAYAWRTILNHGSIIAGGSDFPVEPVNPLLGVFAAVTRQNAAMHPTGGWYPEQRVTREEAVRMFTSWAAYAGFEENLKGSIESGKLADFVVFPEDIFGIAEADLLHLNPDMTILGGEIVYRRP